MSVPVDVEGDLKEIEELGHFLQFQSTLSYLKDGRYRNTQVGTHKEPLDLLGCLNDVAQSTKRGTCQNDYVV